MFGIYIKKPEPPCFTEGELSILRLGNDPDMLDKMINEILTHKG